MNYLGKKSHSLFSPESDDQKAFGGLQRAETHFFENARNRIISVGGAGASSKHINFSILP
jgi:hypothetical protein